VTRGARRLEPLESPDPRIAELEQRRELMGAELAHLEAELEQRRLERLRYRAALEQIAGAESGIWGRIAHEALKASTVDLEAETEAEA
jgi:hypothetical protein